MKKSKNAVNEKLKDFVQLPYGDKIRAAELIGEEVGVIFNNALKRANRFLKKYGFQVSIELKFHYLDDKSDQTNAPKGQ